MMHTVQASFNGLHFFSWLAAVSVVLRVRHVLSTCTVQAGGVGVYRGRQEADALDRQVQALDKQIRAKDPR